jgi:hypothetical protein
MSTLSKSNIITGNVVQAADVSQIVNALTCTGSYDVSIGGTLGVGSATIPSGTKLFVQGYISGSALGVSGDVVAVGSVYANSVYADIDAVRDIHLSRIDQSTGYILRPNVNTFKNLELACEGAYPLDRCRINALQAHFPYMITGSSINITGAVTASNIGSITSVSLPNDSSKVLYGDGTWQTLSVTGYTPLTTYNTFTQSYYVASASFDSRINGITILTQDKILSGNTSVVVSGTNVTVSGSSASTTQFIVTGSASLTGTVTSAGFVQNSSRTLKDNIQPFTGNATDLIDSITVVTYNYKSNPDVEKVGFIAEDTNEVFSTKDKNVLDTGNTIGVLLKSIQELNERIKILESK